ERTTWRPKPPRSCARSRGRRLGSVPTMRQRWQLPLTFAVVVAGTLAFAYLTKSLGFLPGLLAGAWITVQITAAAAVLAVIAAVAAGITKLYGRPPLRRLAVAYIQHIRRPAALVPLFLLL